MLLSRTYFDRRRAHQGRPCLNAVPLCDHRHKSPFNYSDECPTHCHISTSATHPEHTPHNIVFYSKRFPARRVTYPSVEGALADARVGEARDDVVVVRMRDGVLARQLPEPAEGQGRLHKHQTEHRHSRSQHTSHRAPLGGPIPRPRLFRPFFSLMCCFPGLRRMILPVAVTLKRCEWGGTRSVVCYKAARARIDAAHRQDMSNTEQKVFPPRATRGRPRAGRHGTLAAALRVFSLYPSTTSTTAARAMRTAFGAAATRTDATMPLREEARACERGTRRVRWTASSSRTRGRKGAHPGCSRVVFGGKETNACKTPPSRRWGGLAESDKRGWPMVWPRARDSESRAQARHV